MLLLSPLKQEIMKKYSKNWTNSCYRRERKETRLDLDSGVFLHDGEGRLLYIARANASANCPWRYINRRLQEGRKMSS